MIVTLRNLQQQNFTIEIDADQTVLNLKEKIQAEKGYPVTGQKLIYNGKLLLGEAKLADCDIEEKKYIVVMVAKPNPAPAAATTTRKYAMSILEQIASNNKNLLSKYADITGNIHDFKSLVPRLVATGLVAPNQAQEALNDTRHPADLSKALFLWDILLAKMTDVNLRVLQTIFEDTGNYGVAQLLAAVMMA